MYTRVETPRRILAGAAACVLLAGVAYAAAPGLVGGLAYLLPALLLALAMMMGRYPGECALLRAIGRLRTSRRTHRAVSTVGLSPARVHMPRGGRLIASALAVRPPPRPAGVALS